jgi:signal transduction histidine kinase
MDNLAFAFNDMLERIQILVGELREMINNVAHDLRSPVTRIRGMAETTLTGGQALPEYQKMTGNIIEESDNLIEMINTTLEIAEIESGGSVKNLSRNVDINKVIMDAHDLFLPVAENKQIEFEINIVKESLFTRGNVSKLQRAIANLIDNAIKFTPAYGKVQLITGADAKFITVSVVDTGAGISENDLPHIFERFYRAEKSRSTPGNGLGLSLAQAIVTAHGGELTVKSSAGKGTSFKIILPRFQNS